MFQHRLEKETGHHEVNLAPLIDVSLTLVVILLLAAPLAFEASLGIRSDAASLGQAGEVETEDAVVELQVISETEVRVNREVVNRSDLPGRLGPLIRATASRSVTLACSPEVSHGTFVNVVDLARREGAAEVRVIGG
jgi:biopolymer transport protein ExbD